MSEENNQNEETEVSEQVQEHQVEQTEAPEKEWEDLTGIPGADKQAKVGAKFVAQEDTDDSEDQQTEQTEQTDEGSDSVEEGEQPEASEQQEEQELVEQDDTEGSEFSEIELSEEDTIDIINQVAEGTGFSFESTEDLNGFFAHYQELVDKEKQNSQQLQGLTDEEREVVGAIRKFGNVGYYNKVKGMNLDSMSPKDILRQEFMLKEENRGQSEDLLNKVFENDYQTRFSDDEEEIDFV